MNQLNTFNSRSSLDEKFAAQVAQLLTDAIAQKGYASIAVSGGSTPRAFFDVLSKKKLSWEKVTITLADERWVDVDDDNSNSKLVTTTLLKNHAASAHFFNLKKAKKLDSQTLTELNQHVSQSILLPFDVLILGMGEDGHTASLFPCSQQIKEALSLTNTNALMSVTPNTAPYQRITFTLSTLLRSKSIFLHLCGENKYQVLQQALSNVDVYEMPIRAFLHHKNINIQIMFAK